MKIDIEKILSLEMKERFDYLRANKKDLINIKKSTPTIWEVKDSILFEDQINKSFDKASMSKADVLTFTTDVKKSYNEKAYDLYLNDGINQHSIGLQYINISLAINDPEDSEHYSNWTEHFDSLMNKAKAIDDGFFFPVKEYRLIENSGVLFGANELTPVLSKQQNGVGALRVKVVANTYNWIDSQNDVLLPGSAKKSIQERSNYIPHLIDHNYSVMSKVGDVIEIKEEKIDLTQYIKAASAPLQAKSETLDRIDFGKIFFNLNF